MSAEILNRKCRKWIAFEQDLGFAEALEGLFQQHFGAEIPAPRAVTRLEAFAADISLTRFAGKPEDWIFGPARELARETRGEQLDADRVFFARNPEKALGGVRESLYVDDVRIDYVQHAMSGWLHLARLLRDPTYGKSGIPSQDVAAAPAGDAGAHP